MFDAYTLIGSMLVAFGIGCLVGAYMLQANINKGDRDK